MKKFKTGSFVHLTIENGDGGTAVVLEQSKKNKLEYLVYSCILESNMIVFQHEMSLIGETK